MGAGQSKGGGAGNETVIQNETPVQFSQDVVNYLADSAASPQVSPERQATLDAHIRSRIQAELQRLRQEEEDVRQQIQVALEKESLSVEGDATGADEKRTLNSTILFGDLEEVKRKVEHYQTKRSAVDESPLKASADRLLSCYKNNKTRSLDCWRDVAEFKTSVTEAEKQYIRSLQ